MKLLKCLIYVAGLIGLLCLGSCGEEAIRPDDIQSSDKNVKFVLRVGINSPASQTRADYPDGYEYDFEGVATKYEGINTLRVMIVTSDDVVEHNKLFEFTDRVPVNGDSYGPMYFDVKEGKKRVYLIANEASITPAIDFSEDYYTGSKITRSQLEGIELYNEWSDDKNARAVPFINNDDTDQKQYVPMSEFFDVNIKSKGVENDEQEATFFLTRSLVKFSFYINTSVSEPTENFRIKDIEFSNVMQKSYLLPRETVYYPGKYDEVSDYKEFLQRVIKKFETPGFNDNRVLPISFRPSGFGYSSDGSQVNGVTVSRGYAPELYFCETRNNDPDNTFYVNCIVEWAGDGTEEKTTTLEKVPLPNLPLFPRNTHVKVYFRLTGRTISANVILMPYIGVWLDPIFGVGGELGPTEITPELPENND